jgi:hypothetical protein
VEVEWFCLVEVTCIKVSARTLQVHKQTVIEGINRHIGWQGKLFLFIIQRSHGYRDTLVLIHGRGVRKEG